MSSPARASRLRRPAAAALRLPGQVTLPGRPAAAGPGLVTQPHGCEPECQRHASGLEPGRRLGPANEELRLRPGPVAQQRPGPPSPCRVCRLPHWQRCCGGPSSDPSPTAPDDRARASLFLEPLFKRQCGVFSRGEAALVRFIESDGEQLAANFSLSRRRAVHGPWLLRGPVSHCGAHKYQSISFTDSSLWSSGAIQPWHRLVRRGAISCLIFDFFKAAAKAATGQPISEDSDAQSMQRRASEPVSGTISHHVHH